ncbi:MAG: hypothetical protein ACM3SQ_08540 [Betaproteobacteria bacterium]
MTFDEHVRQAFDTLGDRLRDDVARQLSGVADGIRTAAAAERDRATAEAAAAAATAAETRARAEADRETAARLEAAEREAATRLAEAIAEAEARVRADADARTEEARAAAAQAEAEARTARDQAAKAEAEAQKARDQAAQAEAEARTARDQAAQAEHGARSARDLAAQAEADARTAREQVAQLEAEARTAHDQAAQVETEARSVREQLAQAQAEARTAHDQAAQSQAEARDARDRAKDAREQLERQARETAAAAARRPDAAADRLLDAIRSIDRARSLSEILDTLTACAAREAARAAVLVVRGETLHGWRFIGFNETLEHQPGIDLPLDAAGLLADAVRSRTARTAATGAVPPFAGWIDGRPRTAIPLALSGEIVAVLYADQGPGGEPQSTAWADVVEVLARHAARALEAVTAFTAARAARSRPSGAPAAGTRPEIRAEDHEAARRYARLLVSEIRLYHEPEVAAARQARDLGTRLGGEIARARALYEQRVPSEIRSQADYFHAELVRTLADGDAALLDPRRTRTT